MEKKILEYGDAVINERLSKLLPYIKHAKIGLIADTHFNIWQRNNRFFSHIEEMFEGFVDVCQSEAVDCIYILGDLFDAKHTVSTEGLTRVNKMIAMLADRWPMVIIPGNHDMAYLDNSEINLASNYKRHENIVVIDKPAVAFKFGMHQFFFEALVCSDVDKCYDRAHDDAVSQLRIGPVLYGEACTVCAP